MVWVFVKFYKCFSTFLIIFVCQVSTSVLKIRRSLQLVLPVKFSVENIIHPWTSSQCQCCTKDGRVHLSWASKPNVCLIVFLNFYLLCFCNLSPDLQFLICMGSHQHCVMNTRLDQSCCDCCSCCWIHFFVGLHHPVGDTFVNMIYFFMCMWKFLIFFLLLSLLGNFNA